MTRYCRACQQSRATYPDVSLNQRIERCRHCHARLADGPMLPSADRAILLMDETRRFDYFATQPAFRGDHDEKRGRPRVIR